MTSLSAGLIVLIVLIGLIAVIGMFAMGVYNGLVKLRNMYKNAFSQIDVQLKRRNDLIPNLVETAKGYMSHERETLEAVIAARNVAAGARESANPGDPGSMAKLGQAEAGLGGVLGRLFAVAEAYPDLKANQNMMQLSEELTSTENKVAFSRQAYNDSVLAFNNKREVFPNNIVAGMFGFSEASPFEIEDPAQREAPKVQF
ncbi:LemA family protein [Luteolibacter sp. AS25]|uniref:LemA family protein n=1 Tax=Luteolibacter sp. AS25 TaxID=3135776 RepID=UPI00398B2A69